MPFERSSGTAHRLFLRIRGGKPGVLSTESACPLSVEGRLNTVMRPFPTGLDAQDLGSVLSEFAADPPTSVAQAFRSAPRQAGGDGSEAAEPLGVISVMAFVAVTHAFRGTRPEWLDAISWERVAHPSPRRPTSPH